MSKDYGFATQIGGLSALSRLLRQAAEAGAPVRVVSDMGNLRRLEGAIRHHGFRNVWGFFQPTDQFLTGHDLRVLSSAGVWME